MNLLSLNALNRTSLEMLHQTTASDLSYTAQDIADTLDGAVTITGLIATNMDLQQCLADYSQNGTASAYNRLYNRFHLSWQNTRQPTYTRMALLLPGMVLEATWHGRNDPLPGDILETLEVAAVNAQGGPALVTGYSNEYGIFLVRSVRKIADLELNHMGTLVLQIDPVLLLRKSRGYVDSFDNSAQLLYDGQVFFSMSTLDKPVPDTIFHREEQYFLSPDHNLFITTSPVPGHNWQYGIALDYSEMTNTLTGTRIVSLLVTCLCCFLVFFLLNLMLRSILHHLDILMLKMSGFDGEHSTAAELPPYDYSQRKDELGLLHQKFDAMVLRIQQLIQENYLKELLYTEAQLKSLEIQLDPHFLYNTLELVNWEAKAAHVPEISRIVESLGGMLRVVLDKRTHRIPLPQEIALVRDYLTIQQYRFEERLDFSLSVPEELLDVRIPKLTIQPLVENAIRYGLERTAGQCVIRVEVSVREEKLYILVTNTNSAFDDNLLEKLQRNEITVSGFGIGIMNIYERLHLHYHEAADLRLSNTENGAAVQITIPVKEQSPCTD